MGQLDIRFDELDRARRAVDEVRAQFAGVDGDAHDAADSCGHRDLAGKVRDFSSGWDSRRRVIDSELEGLGLALGAIADTFEALDQRFADAIPRDSVRATVHGSKP